MSLWDAFCCGVELAMRLRRVPDRRGQVWQKRFRTNLQPDVETIVVVGEPKPTQDRAVDKLLSGNPVWMRVGWCHRVVDLESGKAYELNEAWFGTWSDRNEEKGDPAWKRVA